MVSVARRLSTIEERKTKPVSFFGDEITEAKATTPKTVLGSNSDEDGQLSNFSAVILRALY
jgi:hypothetical protein